MEEIQGYKFGFSMDDGGIKRTMKELRGEAKMLKSAMKANFAELRSGGDIEKAYAQKVKDSAAAIKAQEAIIKRAKSSQEGLDLETEKGRKEYRTYQTAIENAGRQIVNLKGQQDRAKQSQEYYVSGMAKLSNTIKATSAASEAYVARLRAEGNQNRANQEQLSGLRTKYDQLNKMYDKQAFELKRIKVSSGEASEAFLKQKTRLDQTGKAMAEARTDMNNLNKTIAKANPTVFDRVKSKLSGVTKEAEKSNHLFGKMAIASTIGNTVSTAFSNLTSRLKESVKAGYEIDEAGEKIGKQWKGLGLSNSQVQKMLGQIGDIRNKSNMAGTAVDSLQKRFYALTGSTKDARALTETVTAFGKASGLADEKIAGMAPMMSRLIGSTKVTSSLFTRVMGQAPELQKAIISASGMSQKAFTSALQNGKITGQQLEGYMVKASKNSGKAWAEFGSTSGGMIAKVQGMWKSANAAFAKPLAESALNGISKAMDTLYSKNGELNKTGQSVQNIAKSLGAKVGDGIEIAMDWMVKNRKSLGEIATSLFDITKDIGAGVWSVFSGIIKTLGGHFGNASKSAKPLADSINSISKHPKIFETLGKSLAVYFVASKLTGFIGALTTITRLSKRLIIKPQVDTLTGERQLTAFGTWAQKQMSGIGLNNSIGIGNKWKSMNKVGKVATIAVGAKVVWDASADLAKGLKSKNPDKKLTAYASGTGKVIGGAIGTAMGGPLGGIIGEDIGGKFADKFATGWEKYQKKHPLKVSQVKGYTNQVNYEGYKGLSGDADVNQRKKEGLVASALDPRMWVNADAYLVGDVGHVAKEGAKGASKAWSWLTTTQNPGKGNKPITMPKIKFSKIKLPNIWKWLTTDVKPKTKPIEAPKFKKIKWPSLPKWMNWKTWKWPKFKAPKMPKIKWPKVPNLAKSWSSATTKLSRNFDKWKKSFSKSWSKHWKSTKGTLSSNWTSMLKTSKHWGNNTDSWLGKFKKSFSKSWKKHWKSVKGYLGDRWDDMRSKAGSWGTSMEKWRSKFSVNFKKGFENLGSGLHSIWSGIWSSLKKLAHKGMSGVVGVINAGINGIDSVIHLFGGKKHAIKPVKFATGTGSLSSNFRKAIDRVTPAIVNDEPGAKNPELIYRKASNSVEYSMKKNAHTVLMPGDEVANARDSAAFGAPHFAKGGIGSFFGGIGSAISNTVSGAVSKISQTTNWLKRLFKTATKIIEHPVKSVESLFKYSKNGTKGIFQNLGKGMFDKTAKSAKNWWSSLWSMVDLNGGGSSGGSWRHNPGLSETNGFGASRPFGTHDGVDFAGKLGSPILAVHGGTVTQIGAPGHGWPESQLGKVITVKSSDGYQEIYQEFGGMNNIKVKPGDEIHTGQKIATLGTLHGAGSGSHVHIGVSKGSLWNHGGSSTKGWFDVTKMHGGSDGSSKKSGKSSSGIDKLIKSEVGSGFFKLINKIAAKFGDDAGGSMGNPSGSSVNRWRPYVIKALKANGFSASGSQIAAWMKVIARESNGNPRAVNNWDRNAQAGTPSKGLVQTIGPTFNAYKFKGHGNILNGYDDLLAGINYAKHRYGRGASMFSRVATEGYENGGLSLTHKLAEISEHNLPEMVVPLSTNKRSRGYELVGKIAANFLATDPQRNNSKQIVTQEPTDLTKIESLLTQVISILTGIIPAIYGASPTAKQISDLVKKQQALETQQYNRSRGLTS